MNTDALSHCASKVQARSMYFQKRWDKKGGNNAALKGFMKKEGVIKINS